MDFRELRDSVSQHLLVDWLMITPRKGRQIDVGEEFDVQFTIRNTASRKGSPGFRDLMLVMEGTRYARPVEGPELHIDGRLGPGESITQVVRFQALEADLSTEGDGPPEPIAQIRARARLDLDVETEPKLVRAQIHGGTEPE